MRLHSRHYANRITFVTGTDTGAGKTLLTALLVLHLRRAGIHALGMKPICSGGRNDVRILSESMEGELRDDEINPFYFQEPVAPLVAQRKQGESVTRAQVISAILKLKSRCEWLVVEGAGGLLSPLGQGVNSADLIANLACDVVIAARNRLGVINHVLLTVNALQAIPVKSISVVLMDCKNSDISSRTNGNVLAELLAFGEVFRIPFLSGNLEKTGAIVKNCKIIQKTLACVAGSDNFRPAVGRDSARRVRKDKKPVDSGRSNRKLRRC